MDINIIPIDSVLKNNILLNRLRKLTIRQGAYPLSGMNLLLNSFKEIIKTRPVKAVAIIAKIDRRTVGWAILSQENAEFANASFTAADGLLFEVFVHPDERRKGIGSEILKNAKKIAWNHKLCIVPWDQRSRSFYQKHEEMKFKKITL